MGYTRNPCRELTGIGVTPLAYGHDGLDESFLENIIGHILILDDVQYVGKNTVLVSTEQSVKRRIISAGIGRHQFLIGKPGHLLHCIVLCIVKIK